ncbi:MAG: TAXI family TRAP transporter solute-binding subunit [Rhizobiales bacterium]|nr:TAXI family TRAP transporter solute-binding subunit [Hyphomicrobiales bacterium]
MRKLFIGITFGTCLALASGASAQPLGLGTSPQGTLTYAIGAAVAKTLGEKGMQSRVQPNSGTGTMIPLVNSGEIDVGFANTLELYDAFHGVDTFKGSANPKLRTIGVVFPIRVGLFVRADSSIKSIKDMKGKTIAYGFTSQEIIKKTIDAMLATEGLTIKDLKPVLVPNIVRGVDEFIGGRVDITTFAVGAAKVSEADAAVSGIRYISLTNTPAALAALKKEFRTAYIAKVNPAPNFAGVKEPIEIMQYDYTIFASANLSADRAKAITAIIAENKESLGQGQPLFKQLNPDRLYTNIEVPFHDGAIAYYREKGIKEVK